MEIILIVVAVAMVVGPVMLMKPSGRDRQLASLRQQAIEQGLQTRLTSLPEALKQYSHAPTIAVYQRRWQRGKWQGQADAMLLLRQPYGHGLHFCEQWDWQQPPLPPLAPSEGLSQLLTGLHETVLAVEFGPLGAGLYWLEKGIGVEQIGASFEALEDWASERGLLQL
ncbi:MAG: hypothetical protein OIF35_07000 [Cellvibrionaceae bacterium]|nr:hypothetical protein [Cellvibrionaceae bacterium]MCV6627865.1 hypothetical protein [Cellvibrionaceae bacterium]